MAETLRQKNASTPKAVARSPSATAEQLRELRVVYDPELDRLLARHPNAPEDLLETLSHSSDKATRRHVARHPSAAKDVLLRLAPQFPMDFLRNPVVNWLLMEEPDLLQNLGKGVMRNVLKRPDCPEALMNWAARHGSQDEQLAIAMNPAATAAVVEGLAKVAGPVGLAAICHIHHPDPPSATPSQWFVEELEKGLAALDLNATVSNWRSGRQKCIPWEGTRNTGSVTPSEPPFLNPTGRDRVSKPGRSPGLLGPAQWLLLSPEGRAAVLRLPFPLVSGELPAGQDTMEVAKSPRTPVQILETLSRHPDQKIRAEIATNPAASDAILHNLTNDPDEKVRRALACHPNPPPSVLESLADDAGSSVRGAVAYRPNVPPSFLDLLARDPESEVRLAVAHNPTTPSSVLESLAQDENSWVRQKTANHPNIPCSFLELLASDPDSEVRLAVAHNPTTPSSVLESLAQDKNSWVRQKTANHPNTPCSFLELLASDPESAVRLAVTCNPNTPPHVLESLADDAYFAQKVAIHPRTPLELLQRLSKNLDSAVRTAVAGNPSIPSAIIEALAADPESDVRSAVTRNPSTPLAIIEALALDPDRDVRSATAKNANAPTSVLSRLAADTDNLVRDSVASNPNTPDHILKALAEDSVYYVRRSAALQLKTRTSVLKVQAKRADSPVDRWIAAATDPNSQPELLKDLARRRSTVLHWMLVANPNTPTALRRELLFPLIMKFGLGAIPEAARVDAAALVKRIRCAVAAQHWWHAIKLLAEHHGYARLPLRPGLNELIELFNEEARVFLDNPAATLSAKIMGAGQQGVLFLPATLVRRALKESVGYLQDEESGVHRLTGIPRLLALAHPNAPLDELLKAYRSVEWTERMAVARNPDVPPEILTALQKDAHRLVALQAAETQQLQQAFQQWQNCAVRVHDRWYQQVAALIDCSVPLEGFAGETVELIDHVNRHRERLEPFASGAVVSPESPQLIRIGEEILKNFKSQLDRLLKWLGPCDPLCEIIRRELTAEQVQQVRQMASVHEDTGVQLWGAGIAPVTAEPALAAPEKPPTQLELARSSESSGALLQSLAATTDETIRQAVAENPSAPPICLMMLAGDAVTPVRCAVARHPNLDEETIARLAVDPDTEVRRAVAMRSTPSVQAQTILSTDSDGNVRLAVARNPGTPATVLLALAANLDSDIRKEVATNLSTPDYILRMLASDPDEEVRSACYLNPHIDAETLLKAAERVDRREERKTIAESPVCQSVEFGAALKKFWRTMGANALEPFIQSPASPPEMLAELSQENSDDIFDNIRIAVSSHPATPPEALAKLAADWSTEIRTEVARNAATPPDVMMRLASDDQQKVRHAVAQNPAADAEVLRLLSRDRARDVRESVARNLNTPPDALDILAQGSTTRLEVARHPNARPELVRALMEALAKDLNPNVRRAVVEHPATAPVLLAQMAANDDDHDVRMSAQLTVALRTLRPGVEGNPEGIVLARALRGLMEQRSAFTDTPPGPTLEADLDRLRRGLEALNLLPANPSRKAVAAAVRSSDWLIRFAAALNSKATVADRQRLAQDNIPEVAAAAELQKLGRVRPSQEPTANTLPAQT